MREACSIVDPNRHARGGQRIDAICASARRGPADSECVICSSSALSRIAIVGVRSSRVSELIIEKKDPVRQTRRSGMEREPLTRTVSQRPKRAVCPLFIS